MQANDFSATCNACQHEIGAGSALKPSKAKALDCKHTLCSTCFTSRIRILHQDKIMILKCPIPTCRTVTTKALPAGYCSSARKPNNRNKNSGFKTRSTPSSVEKKIKEPKSVLLEQFNDVALHSIPSPKTQTAMHSDIEWSLYGVRVLYTVVLVGAVAGAVCGCESLFSDPQAHLDSYYSSVLLPGLMFVLLAAEFVPQNMFLTHTDSIRSVQIADILLVLVLCFCTFGDVNYGATHSLGRYLSMSITTHFLPLMIVSVVVLKFVSVLCYVVSYVYGVVSSVMCKLYTRLRYSSVFIRLFGSTNLVPVPKNTSTAPTKSTKHTLTNTTVRTMGLQYDSRYVCAPSVLSISSGSMYGDGVDSVYSNSVLAIEDVSPLTNSTSGHVNPATNTNHTNHNNHMTCATNHTPSIASDTSTESAQMRNRAMNMLVDGYAWDNGVSTNNTDIFHTTNTASDVYTAINTTNTADAATNTIYMNTATVTNHTDTLSTTNTYHSEHHNTTDTTDTTSPTPSSEVYAMYNEIVHCIENLTITNRTAPCTVQSKYAAYSVYDQVDTTPVVYSTHTTTNKITTNTDIPVVNTANADATEYGTIFEEYDSEFSDKYLNDSFEYTQDIVFVPDTIYIPPGELDLSMESAGCADEESGVSSDVHSVNAMSGSASGVHRNVDSEVDSLAYSTSSTSNSIKSNTTNPNTPTDSTTTTTSSTNTLPHTPYTVPTTSTDVRTIDVYRQPTPLIRVPRVPSEYADLNTSPYVTPVKFDVTCVSTPSGRDGGVVNSGYGVNSGISAVYSTPTKGTNNTNDSNTNTLTHSYTTNPTLINHMSLTPLLTPLSTPLHNTSNTTVAESPEDEFKLHSNIKLKPLGMFGWPLLYDNTSAAGGGNSGSGSGSSTSSTGVGISDRARTIYSSSVFSSDMHRHTHHTTSTNGNTTIPDSYYNVYSNPVSPVKGMNTSVDSISGMSSVGAGGISGGIGALGTQKHTSSGTSVMNINNDTTHPNAPNTTATINSSSVTTTTKGKQSNNINNTKGNNANTVNNNANQRFKSILAPSMNLIR